MRPSATHLTLLLLLLLSCSAANGKRTEFGVCMRLSGVQALTPGEIGAALEENDIDVVFFLVPLPLEGEDLSRIREIRKGLGSVVEFHMWILTFRNREYLERHPEEVLISDEGPSEGNIVNPISPAYAEALSGWIRNATSELNPDGIFLDYFYVPQLGPFDNATLSSFSRIQGRNLSMKDITDDPDMMGRFLEWRNGILLERLRDIRDQAQGLELSVFIQMFPESERLIIGQDLEAFARHTDFLVSHTYHYMMKRPSNWVGDGVRALKAEGARDVWAGVQAFDIPAEQLRRAVRSASSSNAEGIMLFRFGTMTEEYWDQVRRARRSWIWLIYVAAAVVVILIGVLAIWRSRSENREPDESRKRVGKRGRRRR